MGEVNSIWWISDNSNQRGAKFRSKQLSYYDIYLQGIVTIMVTFKDKIAFIFTSLVLKGKMLTLVSLLLKK